MDCMFSLPLPTSYGESLVKHSGASQLGPATRILCRLRSQELKHILQTYSTGSWLDGYVKQIRFRTWSICRLAGLRADAKSVLSAYLKGNM